MGDGWREPRRGDDRSAQGGALVFGLLLVIAGAAFLASDQLDISWSRAGWPAFVIVPGIFLLLVGLAIPHEGGLGAAIPGGIITTVGLILATQSATDTYETWSYAWALVAPGSVGATLTLYGLLHRRSDLLEAGLQTAAVGICLFVGFGLFFEYVADVSDGHTNTAMRNALPLVAIALGVVIVVKSLLPRRKSHVPADAWKPVPPAPDAPAPPAPPVPPAPDLPAPPDAPAPPLG
jgi:hypothetical protein